MFHSVLAWCRSEESKGVRKCGLGEREGVDEVVIPGT